MVSTLVLMLDSAMFGGHISGNWKCIFLLGFYIEGHKGVSSRHVFHHELKMSWGTLILKCPHISQSGFPELYHKISL